MYQHLIETNGCALNLVPWPYSGNDLNHLRLWFRNAISRHWVSPEVKAITGCARD